jgi:hypothetical protein
MFIADPRGILALVAVAMCWALAVVLFRAGLPGSMARKLSLLLVFEGVTLVSSGSVWYLFATPVATITQYPWLEPAFRIVHTLGDCAMLALYPAFLAAALHTKFTRPFGSKRMRIGMAILAVALFPLVMLTPVKIGGTLLYAFLALLFPFAFLAAVHAWYVASGIARTRAGIFALAFGFRDVCWSLIYVVAVWEIWTGESFADDPNVVAPRFLVYALGTLVAVPLIAYGILRTQLFDIDLRIRWTIKQSTFAGVIVAVIYLISEGASQFLSSELGNVAGLLAAAVLMFFLTPLQHFAERVASVAMPNTQNTPEYAAHRKMQVYEAAVTEAVPDGNISERERALLNSLRDSLGISTVDADALETELLARGA